MGQLKKLLASLSLRQRISIAVAVVLVGASLWALINWKRERDFRPLYSGLSAEDAGAVVQKLRESGADYRLAENGAVVLAPEAKVAELRLQMAAAGLPKSGRVGFELFDKSNFGLTDFAEHINYRRAVEGELERSVMALTEVQQARVHVTFPKDSIFLEARQPAKASVMVRLKPGARLSPPNVLAITHLVASAVEGLVPEAVSVLDMNGNLLGRPRRPASLEDGQPSEAVLEFRHQMEKDLVAKINSTLEPLLGPEKFRAGVSVECDFSSGEQSEETFDPTRSVMSSSQKTEDLSGVNTTSGVPGTASNLPRPTSRPGAAGQGTTRRTENISYQSSRTVRRVRLPQGSLKRMSAAVLVDHSVRWEGSGAGAKRVLESPSPEKLKVIRDLVAAATGFNAERGDQLIVESLPFESTLSLEAPAPQTAPAAPPASGLPPWLERLQRQSSPLLLAAVAGGVVLLILAAAVLFWIGRKRRKGREVALRAGLPGAAGAAALESGEAAKHAEQNLQSRFAEQLALRDRQEAEALSAMKLPLVTTKKAEVLAKHLVELAKKDPASTTQVLRTWLKERQR
jgi:flagellar M-ring protein FliF